MKILIDGRFIGVGESISRYTLEILNGILELDKENEYTLLIRPQGVKEIENWKLRLGKYQLHVLDIPHYSVGEQTELLNYLNQEKFDLVHFTQFNHPIRYKGKYVICVHDLTLLGHLYRMNFLKRWGFRKVMKSAVNDSTKIITISNTTKKDIVETYNVDPGKIEVTYLAADDKYNSALRTRHSELINFRKKYGISENYILYTGMWKRHKNILRMLQAFEKYKLQIANHKLQTKNECHSDPPAGGEESNDNQLVLVGKVDREEPEVLREMERINKKLKTDNSKLKAIVTTGFIDEEELPIAYAAATAYIIPSLSEGFGLPPLEAMACGTPVLSSKISAMPEILGKAPFYFDPYDVEDMSMAMKTVMEDKELQAELSEKGLEQVKLYDWSKTAKETLDVYKSILK